MNCYAEGIAYRFGGEGQPYEGLIASTGQWNGKVKFVPAKLIEPIRWKRPRLIFVNSMSDLFHESVPDHEIDQIFGVMWACLGLDHTFQILTKRAKRMHDYFKTDRREAWARWAVHYGGGIDPDAIYDQTAYAKEPHPNIWLGVSVEDQAAADERIPYLLETPAAVRWISAEPLLGAIDLSNLDDGRAHREIPKEYWSEGFDTEDSPPAVGYCSLTGDRWLRFGDWSQTGTKLDWVVVGGESGHGARPMHLAWARSIRDQCDAAEVPFHFKQWGEWAPRELWNPRCTYPQVAIKPDGSEVDHDTAPQSVGGQRFEKVGKKLSGRLLDGREWNEYPLSYQQGKA